MLGQGKNRDFHSLVRAKTFSTHVVSEIRHVVSKTGVFTHVTT